MEEGRDGGGGRGATGAAEMENESGAWAESGLAEPGGGAAAARSAAEPDTSSPRSPGASRGRRCSRLRPLRPRGTADPRSRQVATALWSTPRLQGSRGEVTRPLPHTPHSAVRSRAL